MNQKFSRVILYIRVSTREQAESGYSMAEQEARLRAYCDAMGWTPLKVCADPGFSGAKLLRPGLQELLEDVDAHRCDAVLVWKLDRLSRTQKDTLFLIEDKFLVNDVAFISMNENFDTSTPFGRAMIGILSVFAQLEREQIRERMQMGMDARAKTGKYHGGGYDVIGYDYINGELIVNEYEAAQVREVFDLYVNKQWAIHKIRKHMAERYTLKYGAWGSDSTVYSVLSCRVYIGQMLWKGEYYEGTHEHIIPDELFNAAQERRSRTKWVDGIRENGIRRESPFQSTTILGGLIFCGHCGARYYTKGNYSGHGDKKKYHPYYTCYSRGKSSPKQIRDPNCKNPSYPIDKLDSIVLEEIRKLSFDQAAFAAIVAGEGQTKSENKNDIKVKRKALEDRIHSLHTQVSRLISLCRVNESMPVEEIATQIEAAQNEIDRLEKELAGMEAPPVVPTPDMVDRSKELLSNASVVIDNGTVAEKQALVRGLIDRITIYPDHIEIRWKFSPQQ
ncbi:MAG: recombinase family protein [Lachnospiraceae bacterium]|nr:recombinase family protein [Lachnospiraceae bacterium]